MKKILALILAGAMLFAFAACGGNESTDEKETTTEAAAAALEVADAADLLNKVWATYADEEKFFAMGGDMNNPADNMAGKYDITLVEDLDATLGLPQASAALIDDAASLMHAMMANNFTGAAYHLKADTDAVAFVDALKTNIQSRQWICGFPETLLIATVGDYVVSAFGSADIIATFKAKLQAQYDIAVISVEEPVA